jgi:hypothetical protein
MDLPEPPRPDQSHPVRIFIQTPVPRPIWKRGWFWIGVFVVLALIGTAIESGQGEGDADKAPRSDRYPDVEDIPIFDGQPGGQVVALVNKEGIVSAKVLGELPTTCTVSAGNVVQWDKSSSSYQDTGVVATDLTLDPADSLMATFLGPVGTGDQQGYVFHADMNLQPPYPKAIVVTLDCSY